MRGFSTITFYPTRQWFISVLRIRSGSTCFWASWIRILLSSCKNSKKNLDSYYFVTPFDFLSLKNDVNVPSKSNRQKKLCYKICFLLASWRSMTKIAGSGSRSGSGSISQKHGSADPDPPQNVMDPQQWFIYTVLRTWTSSGPIALLPGQGFLRQMWGKELWRDEPFFGRKGDGRGEAKRRWGDFALKNFASKRNEVKRDTFCILLERSSEINRLIFAVGLHKIFHFASK